MSTGLSRDSDRLGEAASESCRQESEEKGWKSCKETSRAGGLSPLSGSDAEPGPIVDMQPGTVGDGLGKCFRFLSLLFSGAAAKPKFSLLWSCCVELRELFWKEQVSLSNRAPLRSYRGPASSSSSSLWMPSSAHGPFPSPLWFSLLCVCRLCFIRLFWNHTFTCLSVRSNRAAISTLLGRHRYLLKWNSFSSSSSCVLVYAVLSRREPPPPPPALSTISGEPRKQAGTVAMGLKNAGHNSYITLLPVNLTLRLPQTTRERLTACWSKMAAGASLT